MRVCMCVYVCTEEGMCVCVCVGGGGGGSCVYACV